MRHVAGAGGSAGRPLSRCVCASHKKKSAQEAGSEQIAVPGNMGLPVKANGLGLRR